MAKLDAPQVADLLLEIGRRASLEAGNPYKAKAYIRAAESLRTLVIPLGEVVRRSQLRAIPGVGDAIARRIIELRNNGTDKRSTAYEPSSPRAAGAAGHSPRLNRAQSPAQ